MRIQYHITPQQIQETILCLAQDNESTPLYPTFICWADIKIFSDTKPDEFIACHNVFPPEYFSQIREFVHSNQTRGTICGIPWGEYDYYEELYMPTGTSFLSIGPKPGIKINFRPTSR